MKRCDQHDDTIQQYIKALTDNLIPGRTIQFEFGKIIHTKCTDRKLNAKYFVRKKDPTVVYT